MIGVTFTPLQRISTSKGDVLHGLKATDQGFAGFGEAYFSLVLGGSIKGWKRHNVMTLNLICVQGAIQFVVYGKNQNEPVLNTVLSPDNTETYARLTIPPMFWVGFSGVSTGTNMLLNVASHVHDPQESETRPLDWLIWPA